MFKYSFLILAQHFEWSHLCGIASIYLLLLTCFRWRIALFWNKQVAFFHSALTKAVQWHAVSMAWLASLNGTDCSLGRWRLFLLGRARGQVLFCIFLSQHNMVCLAVAVVVELKILEMIRNFVCCYNATVFSAFGVFQPKDGLKRKPRNFFSFRSWDLYECISTFRSSHKTSKQTKLQTNKRKKTNRNKQRRKKENPQTAIHIGNGKGPTDKTNSQTKILNCWFQFRWWRTNFFSNCAWS